MEQNLQILPKKVWSMFRVFYFMLRKGISKRKLWMDLNMMMKRAKIIGKSFHNLMFHRHHNWAAFATAHPQNISFPSPDDDSSEFSCTASPLLQSPAMEMRSPMVRELRITDSPFPVCSADNHVDEAAEQFISRFYNELRHQNTN